jgi:dGTPase
MAPDFYNDFDRGRRADSSRDWRTPFRRDRDRLIHNASFRRLQAKTQVFLSGDYDFYRTRLTHSIEVAQIAGSICGWLNHGDFCASRGLVIDADLCDAAALAHDIGHPPFGHAGEVALHRCMQPYGGFEGNAQTLRLVASTIYTSGGERRGLNPTRGLLDAILKYKTLYGETPNAERHFLYDDQRDILAFVTGGRDWPADLVPGSPRNGFRSLECQIMDWADDTGYSLNDLVDSAHAGFITTSGVRLWAEANTDSEDGASIDLVIAALTDGSIERVMNRRIGSYIEACSLAARHGFLSDLTNRHRYDLVIAPPVRREQTLFARLANDLVFRSPQVSQLEHKGQMMVTRLFEALRDTYLVDRPRFGRPALISRDFEQDLERADLAVPARARILCDYLAGMTDGFATRVYRRMFDPGFGSIVDLV